jgi:hypothetical protein
MLPEKRTKVRPVRQTVTRVRDVAAFEQYLNYLCDRSFLSLWSYPGLPDKNKP